MKIVEAILTKNPCYTAGRKIEVKGLMLHSVGCSQPKASAFVNYWNDENYGRACVHAFIDAETGEVYQTLPWNHRGWHGGGASNNTHIGVEMCEPGCIKYTGSFGITVAEDKVAEAKEMVERTYQSAVELFAILCKTYVLNPMEDGVIISHTEGYKRGIASNHGDPEHLWKQLKMGYTMDGFRQDVKKEMEKSGAEQPIKDEYYRVRKSWSDVKSQKGAYKVLANAKKCADKNNGYFVFDEEGNVIYPVVEKETDEEQKEINCPYLVKVSITDLNIRKGPGTNYGIAAVIARGVYTIVAEADGKGASKWGKLKSGAGWISLDYVNKV